MPKAPSSSSFSLAIEYYREEDGRSLADIPALPCVTAYGRTKKQATAAVQALALRLIADRLEHWEAVAGPMDVVLHCRLEGFPRLALTKTKQALAALLRIGWRIKRQSGT
jgi:hypothetical protein